MKRIRKFAFSLAMLLFLVSPVLAQSPVKIYFMGPAGHEKVVSATDPLPVISIFSSLPLPLGASTEATLQLILNELTDPDSKAYITDWPSTYNIGNWPSGFNVNNWPTTQQVHETAFPDTYPVEGGNTNPVKVNDNTMPDTWYVDVQAKLAALTADVPLTMAVYEITLADTTNFDSSTVLPDKCVAYEFWTKNTTHTLEWMTNSGIYATKNPGIPYNTFGLGANKIFNGRLYFKDTTEAGCVVVLIVWTKP